MKFKYKFNFKFKNFKFELKRGSDFLFFALFCRVLYLFIEMNAEVIATGKVKTNGNKRKIAPSHPDPEAKKPYYHSKFMSRSLAKKDYAYYFIDTPLCINEIDSFFKTLIAAGYPASMITSYKFEQTGKREFGAGPDSDLIPTFHTEFRIKCEPEFDINAFANQFFQDSVVRPMIFDRKNDNKQF